jgi:hypothetical protein
MWPGCCAETLALGNLARVSGYPGGIEHLPFGFFNFKKMFYKETKPAEVSRDFKAKTVSSHAARSYKPRFRMKKLYSFL